MKNRKSILLVVLLLAVGFAAVSTTLYINGSTNINPNQDDFEVYYSDAYVNGKQDKSVITDDTHISFTTELSILGQKYILDYEVTNGSKNYDAELEMVCTGDNEYLTVTNEFDDETVLVSQEKRIGKLILELTKSNAGEDVDVIIKCAITANAVERTELNTNEIGIIEEYIIEGNYVDENGNAIDNANLVIFSDTPHYVTTDVDGYLFYNGLEKGEHEIYYLKETVNDIKNMSKDEIIKNASASATFNTTLLEDIVFTNSYKLTNNVITEVNEYCNKLTGSTWNFDYINGEEILKIKCDGVYTLETWGAEGGGNYNFSSSKTCIAGYGAYSTGNIIIDKNRTLYINVGGKGIKGTSTTKNYSGGYNGGGSTTNNGDPNSYGGSGGGATHIAYKSGELQDLEDYMEDIIIVSAGGGGAGINVAVDCSSGGSGGGTVGKKSSGMNGTIGLHYAYGGSQLNGGSCYYSSTANANSCHIGEFGVGATALYAGAGGGFYGGAAFTYDGAGGSSYIGNPLLTEKSMYCYECDPSEDEDTKTISVKTASDVATSNTPKKGNGYAKIIYLGE